MANNFEKRLAIWSNSLVDGSAVQLPDKDLGVLLSFMVEGRPSKAFGLDLPLIDDGAKSYTYSLIQGGVEKPKTAPGNQTWDKTHQLQKTVYFKEPTIFNPAMLASDLRDGLDASAAKYEAKHANQHTLANERAVMQNMYDSCVGLGNDTVIDLLDSSLTPLQIYNIVISKATALTKYRNDNVGIDGVAREKILINLQPEIFDKIAIAGLIGDRAQKTYDFGQYAIGTISGYKVISNPYLPIDCEVLVGTTFCWATATKYVAANSGKIDLTNDIGIYLEFQELDGGIYPELVFSISSAIKPTSITLNTFSPQTWTEGTAKTFQFTATILPNDADLRVTWQVKGADPYDGKITIDQTGLLSFDETMDAGSGTITIEATSVADPQIHGESVFEFTIS